MHRYRRLAVFGAIVIVAVVSVIFLTGLFADFDDPALQRALLRLLAILGAAAMLAMCGSLLMRAETIDQLAQQPVDTRRARPRR